MASTPDAKVYLHHGIDTRRGQAPPPLHYLFPPTWVHYHRGEGCPMSAARTPQQEWDGSTWPPPGRTIEEYYAAGDRVSAARGAGSNGPTGRAADPAAPAAPAHLVTVCLSEVK